MQTSEPISAILRQCSVFHYQMLDMDRVLEPYIGDTEAFFGFLTQSWGWIITVEEGGRVVYADENKDTCVCPMKEGFGERGDLWNLCYCSEGFAERMFARVYGRPVRARVIRSVIRDGQSCVYRIESL